jgi:ABC-2 type transport system ATP-binding protein
MTAAIKVKNLTVVRERQTILSGLTAQLPAGQIIGLLGPSGAGKTTFIRALVGLQRVKPGSVTVLGQPAGSAALRRQIGYMSQSPAVYSDLSVAENLAYFAAMIGVRPPRVSAVLAEVDLAAQARQLVSSLSGGQRSRLSLAIALLGEPSLLVLDEPTVGVDPVLRAQLWTQFRRQAQQGRTLIISSHVMDEAAHCDQLLLIRDGQILAQGSPKQLQEQTHTRSIEQAFIASIRAAA